MLLAAGAKSRDPFEIVPIIIDPHKSNEDLKRTVRLMENYQSIVEKVGIENGFFTTKLTTLNNLRHADDTLSSSFTLGLQQVANKKFSEYIAYNQLEEENKALANVLFSGSSIDKHGATSSLLDIQMDIGFVGNPNIGSVVLNQFKDSEEFKTFASLYQQDDRIFIISSIFGGTGAAGFPTILKNIRDAVHLPDIQSRGILQNARIGALTVLPYFNIKQEKKSPINKADFIGKTKAALYYYMDNVNDSVNAMYYLSDDYNGQPYQNDPGDRGQKNDAHFIEMAAATAIIDFMDIPDDQLKCHGGRPDRPVSKEFGVRKKDATIRFDNFEDETEMAYSMPLSQFMLFNKFLDEEFSNAISVQTWSVDLPKIDERFKEGTFFRSNIQEFNAMFAEWLKEMERNERSFAPFHTNALLPSVIHGKSGKSSLFSKLDMAHFNHVLSRTLKGQTYASSEQKFIHLFYNGTRDLLISKFGYGK